MEVVVAVEVERFRCVARGIVPPSSALVRKDRICKGDFLELLVRSVFVFWRCLVWVKSAR